jgi:hypothetical protein
MSTFEEEKNSIEMTRRFLFDLMNPQATPKVPKYIRLRARQVVKHYPVSLDIFMSKWYNSESEEMTEDTTK